MSIDAFFFSAGGAERAQRIHRRGAGAPRRGTHRRGDARPGRGSAGGRLLRLCVLSGRAPSGASSGLHPDADPGSACSAFSGKPGLSVLRALLRHASCAPHGCAGGLRRTALVYHSPAVAFFHAPLPVRRGSARIAGGGRPPDTARRAGVQPRALLHVLPCGILRQSIADKLRLAEDCGAAHVLLLPPETDVL